MSTCISRHGEYSEHKLDANYTCELCGEVDSYARIHHLRAAVTELAHHGDLTQSGKRVLLGLPGGEESATCG